MAHTIKPPLTLPALFVSRRRRMLRTALVATSATLSCLAQFAEATPVNIGNRRELFVDHFLIEKLEGEAELQLQKPVDRGVVVTLDAPWEGNTSAYNTVFEDGDLYRMYYRGWHHQGKEVHPPMVCYAKSRDGITWVKPNLGLFEFNGSKENNVIWQGEGSHNFVPFVDGNANCPTDEKYKAVGGLPAEGGLFGFVSSDGIRWRAIRDTPIIKGYAFDSQNLVFRDTARGQYRAYFRHFRDGVRGIMTATSKDFLTWSEAEWLTYPGAATEHLYTNQISPYHRAPHLFIGFPSRYLRERGSGVEGLFMTSRDGLTFSRWAEALVRPGLNKDKWGNRCNYIWYGVVETDPDLPGAPRELSLYTNERYYRGNGSNVRRHTFRLDGFVSVHAPMRGGTVVTKPLIFSGDVLRLNYSTSLAGSVEVNVLNAEGKPVATFATGVIYGDAVDQVVMKGLSGLAGKPVRLRFTLHDADIFAFQFDDE